jgi:hypothetical protein
MNSRRQKPSLFLSKSQFIRGLQCPKSLYLLKYHPELQGEPDESRESVIETGYEVEEYARRLFPGGIEIPFDEGDFNAQFEKTQDALERVDTIYSASFIHDNLMARVDILKKNGHRWDIYEVKSSTSVKDHYINDIAFQYYVLKNAGLPAGKAFIVYINNQYVRQGDIEADKLFTIEDLTETILEKQPFVEEDIKRLREILQGDMPDIPIGPYCDDPYECDFAGHCWKDVQDGSVFDLKYDRSAPYSKWELYEKNYKNILEIPEEFLGPLQQIQIKCLKEGTPHIDREGIKDFLSSLWHPMYFLDFETIDHAIPLFDGTRPYQKIPTQYSLHYQQASDEEIKHLKFLAMPGIDPRREIAENLSGEIPDNACVIVYNKSFESGILRGLADAFPEYAEKLNKIIENIRDLIEPFKYSACYYPEMGNSASLKAVVPALLPEFSYDDLDVQDGGMAMDAYWQMCEAEDDAERQRIRQAMLEYCKRDTLVMVKLVEVLKSMVDEGAF